MSFSASSLEDPSLFVVDKTYIAGQWVSAKSGQLFEVKSPATDTPIGSVPESGLDDLNDAIQAAYGALGGWKRLSGRQRGRILRKVFELLMEHQDDLSTIITLENGKAKADATGEVLLSANFFEWYSEEAARIYGDVIPNSTPNSRTRITKEAIGVCGLITPWNFPLAMGVRKIAAALAAGCTIVLKSDGLTPFSSNALAVIGERAGIPEGVFNIVTAAQNTPQLGLALCESDIVKKISFTGSTRVGKLLYQQSARTLKKLSLELGGNAAFIVFDDAYLETAISSLLIAKFKVTGQTCVCANRIFVQEGIYKKFSQRLIEEVKKFRIGNSLTVTDGSITHGPLTNGTEKVESHIKDAIDKNAKVLLGGSKLPSLGRNFHEFTILGDVNDTMQITQEETFGPVAALLKFSSEDEVIKRANNSDVGLASYVMTSDLARSYRVSERLETGMIAVNTGVVSDAPVPFGGVKHSGFGREGSKYGLDDYLTIKMVVTGGI
ncbi:hypothetical protein LTR10_023482 [Elasticomyces elasticus]|uniref:Aldehyde dehydrogenase domain-containing protein n=1 Tax=Exophiala sideris TaxID=1016849 RepID=A0ABR0J6Q4_9EURO|nr:hypothetical protein LTR10_023482 [Elasticomyces elasticus]KAK5028817.1 hypothetical protein LTS07_006196 [Exophiala sideris]KAK5035686.1 hypothetical protein LTR13_005815 [Exophiala sideris]KAK5057321.1 hypothetical protein LTR69_007360 [Exophiala sideris]KAK5181706.1 hypothetical protein LTR44_005906 [Eurotiomycetes sp. CCFEE 6388]